MDLYRDVVDVYSDFASEAADSETFSAWSKAVVEDEEVLAWLRTLPGIKQQPNLVYAAARWHGVPAPGPYENLREALLGDDGSIRETILTRSTQTNEVGRLATLLPAFSTFDGPLALLEVGPSAGLCLYPDQWSYEWTVGERGDTRTVRLDPPHLSGDAATRDPAGVLPCRVKGDPPLPDTLPEVTWRGGVDLNPLDVDDADDMAWLEQLVFPEQDERRARLRHAIEVARRDPPHLEQGNLLTELPRLVEKASAYGTVVVFHTAVIPYLPPEDRKIFDEVVRGLVAAGSCHWVSNEGPAVLPSVTETGPEIPRGHPTFVLGIDGRMVAKAHGHGRTLTWTA